jgi:hypothetical protein
MKIKKNFIKVPNKRVPMNFSSNPKYPLDSARPEMVNLARVQGGRQIQTGGILLIFRGFEFVAQRRNRVRDAVSGWAIGKKIEVIRSFNFHPSGVPEDFRFSVAKGSR